MLACCHPEAAHASTHASGVQSAWRVGARGFRSKLLWGGRSRSRYCGFRFFSFISLDIWACICVVPPALDHFSERVLNSGPVRSADSDTLDARIDTRFFLFLEQLTF